MSQSSPGPSGLVVWRLMAARFAEDVFDGEGARRHGGRWNHTGTPMVYASERLSLAALELFVHLDPLTAPSDLMAISLTVPSEIDLAELPEEALPRGWRRYPAPETVRSLGSVWARTGATLGLWVPSAVIPSERNLLINPDHPERRHLRVRSIEPFHFDPRMWKSR